MYLIKNKKTTDQQNERELNDKRDKVGERSRPGQLQQSPSNTAAGRNVSEATTRVVRGREFHPEDLPDGACFAPLRVVTRDTECTAVREAAYIGSFSVVGTDQSTRTEYVRQKLEGMRIITKSKPILLVISLSGIKICSSNGESVYMAHAMKRISYATCDPEYKQFSFLAREPKGQMNVQYCHAFIAESPEQAEELNTIVGNAFKMAYAHQRKKQPTFNELIEEQIKQQKAKQEEDHVQAKEELNKRLSMISTTSATDLANARREIKKQQSIEAEVEKEAARVEKEAARVVGKNKVWAKQVAPKSKHRSSVDQRTDSPPPLLKQNIDLEAPRSYGSPVVALKDSIDNQDTLPVHHRLSSPSQSVDFDRKYDKKSSPRTSNRHRHSSDKSSPVSSRERRSNGHVQRVDEKNGDSVLSSKPRKGSDPTALSPGKSNDMSTRPLPAPPSDDFDGSNNGSRPSSASSGQQDTYKRSASDPVTPISMRSSDGRSSSPAGIQRYQNDSPFRPIDSTYIDAHGGSASPTLPTRLDSLRRYDGAGPLDDSTLRQASWYQAGIPREIALEILSQEEIGAFIVRDSTTHPGCYALSVKVPKFDNPSGISHYLITRTSRGGYRLKGLEKEWPSLMALVIHHTVMQEMLPCTLRLPRNTQNPSYNETEKDEKDEDEDYQRLSDFTSMMADLKMGK